MRFAFPILATLIACPAWAQSYKAEFCANADGVIEQIECYTQEYVVADANLNAAWRRVIADHPSGGVREEHTKDIRAAQRAWIAFRDTECEAVSKIGIPKYWGVNKMACLYSMTRARTDALK